MTKQELYNHLNVIAKRKRQPMFVDYRDREPSHKDDSDKYTFISDEQYAVLEKMYIAFDIDKKYFAEMIYDNIEYFCTKESKWDFMIEAHEREIARLRYEENKKKADNIQHQIAMLQEEQAELNKSIEEYRRKNANAE